MNELIAAGFGALGTIIVAAIGLYGAQRAGIGKTQERLVQSLKDLVDAQGKTIAGLEKKSSDQQSRIQHLEDRVQQLTDLTVSQAAMIETLRRKRTYSIREDDLHV